MRDGSRETKIAGETSEKNEKTDIIIVVIEML